MSLLELITGNDYVTTVKKFIKKVFDHEARKYHCQPHELKIVIDYDVAGKMSIMTFSNTENKIWRIIPDKEVQDILMK